MTTGERMKKRRKEIRFSAEKVAALLGVSPATIYRYEKGDIEKVPGDIIEPLSKILRTTPAYLMGWDETPTLRTPAAAVARTKADNTTRMEFFEILRRLRENSNLDQADMALILGVERTVYNEWETGKTQPDFKTLLLLADYFDCTTDYLLGRVDEPDLIKKELPVQRSGELEAITVKKWASNDEEIIRVAQEAARRAIEDYKRDHNPD